MPGVGVGNVLPDEWNEPKHPPWRYTRDSKPYIIEIEGYRVTLLNYVTGNMVNIEEDTEFETLCTLMKMGSMPRAVLQGEIEL